MGRGLIRKLIVASVAVCVWPNTLQAQTATTYEYDALGRLTKVLRASSLGICYKHDGADNREVVAAASSCAANSAPSAQTDYEYAFKFGAGWWGGDIDVLWNDDADLPFDQLKITSVSGSSYATLPPEGNAIAFYGPPGSYTINYSMKDAYNQTSSATLYLEIIHCNPDCGIDP